jgi:hypothetical protein
VAMYFYGCPDDNFCDAVFRLAHLLNHGRRNTATTLPGPQTFSVRWRATRVLPSFAALRVSSAHSALKLGALCLLCAGRATARRGRGSSPSRYVPSRPSACPQRTPREARRTPPLRRFGPPYRPSIRLDLT